jgi:hypothetical protein
LLHLHYRTTNHVGSGVKSSFSASAPISESIFI